VYAVDVDPFRRPGAAAEEELRLAFGEEGLERLRALKAEVDPEGLFRATLPL
jgi:FAD/FMN-containing dehydrogenase